MRTRVNLGVHDNNYFHEVFQGRVFHYHCVESIVLATPVDAISSSHINCDACVIFNFSKVYQFTRKVPCTILPLVISDTP